MQLAGLIVSVRYKLFHATLCSDIRKYKSSTSFEKIIFFSYGN